MLIIVFLGFLIMVVFAIVLLFRVIFAGSHTFVKTPKKQLRATIFGKRSRDVFRASGVYTNYFITFELGEGDYIELSVDKKLFKEENIGVRGILTYKGNIFLSFVEEKDETEGEKSTVILNGAEFTEK